MSLLTEEETHPIALLTWLTQKYGAEWMAWPPTVLRTSLERDGESISRVNLYKALSAGAVATRDEFWQYWETFHYLVQGLNGYVPTADAVQEQSVGQMMVACELAHKIRTMLKELSHQPEYSEEVCRYIVVQAQQGGIWYLPAPLDFAEKYMEGRSYRCRDCGNEAEIVFDDGHCDLCVNRYETEHLGSWDADTARTALNQGKNIEYFSRNPSEQVKKRLAEVLARPETKLEENSVDICVARLVAALDYLHSAQGTSS